MSENKPLKLGTRPSPLACYQCDLISSLIKENGYLGEIEQVKIASEGDLNKESPLAEIGGKGVFIKRIEAALLEGSCDVAVHSLKDVTAALADETSLVQFYTEGFFKDCIAGYIPFEEMTHIATSSLRRRLFLNKFYPHLTCVDIRGNVGTRIATCKDKKMGVMLSEVGLQRLNMQTYCQKIFDPKECVPAPGQGYIALQAKQAACLPKEVYLLSDKQSAFKASFYMDLIKGLNFSCQIPLGAYLEEKDNTYKLILSCGSKDLKIEKRWEHRFVAKDRDTVLKATIRELSTWYQET